MSMEDIGHIELTPQGKYSHLRVLVDDDYDGEYFSCFKWYISPHGYAYRPVGKHDQEYTGKHGRIIYLHQEVARTPKGMVTDHINRNKLDNRSCNLRWADWILSAQNRKQPKRVKTGSCGYKGVWDIYANRPEAKSKYKARKVLPKRYATKVARETVSYHTTPLEAAKAYDKLAYARWGELAELNFPVDTTV